MEKFFCFCFFASFLLISCQNSVENQVAQSELFSIIPSESSGLDFVNNLEETTESNYYRYLYTYIGGGVAAGDINNDGLIDLYFTANRTGDKLYLNKGGMKFEDITQSAGIEWREGFNTGVTMADINADGYLDIYVSRGGWKDENGKFENVLYINNGDLTFSEKAQEHGLADPNRTIQATFFDYDRDNDLDVYISNTPNVTSRSKIIDLNIQANDPEILKLKGSDRFYENDGSGFFTDVSQSVGLIYDIGFGLNPQVADLNDDGWLDIYVCNDFNYPDLVYLNNGNKTFTQSRDEVFKHMSFNSMGSDIADVNNDGLFDLMTLDMNPEDYIRSKTTMTMTSLNRFESMVANGYHHQYMHNMLQLNNGNGTYREVGNMTGMANTDWSWALLSADFDLDGWNDVYITNGVYRDVLDQDKNNEIRTLLRKNGRKPTPEDLLAFTQMLPQQKIRNYFFRNTSELSFEDISDQWAAEKPTFSNGATYADLDNDGDLDLVVNNINDPATLLKNETVEIGNGDFVKFRLAGPTGNPFGIGAKLSLIMEDGSTQIRHHIPTRGYLSSVSNELYFGFNRTKPDRVEIVWPDGRFQAVDITEINQLVNISYQENLPEKTIQEAPPIFTHSEELHHHEDPYFNDYGLQVLLPHKLSQTGPFAAQGDINGDGVNDVFIGGGHKQAGQIFIGKANGGFTKIENDALTKDAFYEDQGALLFDADNDGDLDLYVVSGSYEFFRTPRALQDRLYLNDGQGQFERGNDRLPTMNVSGSVAQAFDYDQDGDLDLFVGGRMIPGKYPYAPRSYILKNENGFFKDITKEIAPDIASIGMVTDAVWTNLSGGTDLIITGEWMGIEVFTYANGKLTRNSAYSSLAEKKGWWNKLLVTDIDGDGDQDIIAGNLGLNSKFHASSEKPFRIYTKDFDANGSEDILLAKEYEGKHVPIRGKTCMTQQMPYLANRISSYNEFANLELEEIVGADLSETLQYEVTEFRSGIFVNEGDHAFAFRPLASDAQTSPINSILFEDLNGDGHQDLLVAGNNYHPEVETTRNDAGISTLFQGNGTGEFSVISNLKTGLFLDQDIRDLEVFMNNEAIQVLVIHNNGSHQIYTSRP